MASKKKGDEPATTSGDSMLDKSGDKVKGGTFMHDKADLDRTDARTSKLQKGLSDCKEHAATMVKAIAHGIATESEEMVLAVLDEVANLGATIRDRAKRAIREGKASQNNEQS